MSLNPPLHMCLPSLLQAAREALHTLLTLKDSYTRAENKSESLLMIDGKDSGRLLGQVHHAVVLQRFHRPANNHLQQTPKVLEKQYEQFRKKCFKLNLETQLLCLERLVLFGTTEKGKYSPFGCRCFYLCFSGLQKNVKKQTRAVHNYKN